MEKKNKMNITVKMSKFKMNPNNPRVIKDDKFKKLCKSIEEFSEMLSKRKIVCVTDADGKMYPLGGNMRLKALKELGYNEIPMDWIDLADDWTEEQRREFLIKDNVGFGEWDWDILANEWDAEQLEDWGLDIPNFGDDENDEIQKDLSDDIEISFRIEITLINEKEQEKLYNELINKGYLCKLLTL